QPFGWPQGWVRGFPINDRKLRARFALFVLGGPLASLAAGLACLLVTYQLNESVIPEDPQVQIEDVNRMLIPRNQVATWMSIAAFWNLSLFLFSLVPTEKRGYSSDVVLLLQVLRGGRGLILIGLHADLMRGVRPRDWDSSQVEQMLSLRSGTAKDVLANLYGYYHAVDNGDWQLAGQLIDLAMAQGSGVL